MIKFRRHLEALIPGALLALCAAIVFLPVTRLAAEDDSPIDESAPPEVQGQQLAEIIRTQYPIENYQTQGLLSIRSNRGQRQEFKIASLVYASPSQTWTNIFQVADLQGRIKSEYLIIRNPRKPNIYFRTIGQVDTEGQTLIERAKDPYVPIGNSDFMMADMGFDFLFWPNQQVIRQQIRSGRNTYMLESTPAKPEVYGKVLSWIDKKTLGPMRAEAYDLEGRLIKVFTVGGIKEINGEKVVSRFDMENSQTGYFSRIEFNE